MCNTVRTLLNILGTVCTTGEMNYILSNIPCMAYYIYYQTLSFDHLNYDNTRIINRQQRRRVDKFLHEIYRYFWNLQYCKRFILGKTHLINVHWSDLYFYKIKKTIVNKKKSQNFKRVTQKKQELSSRSL